MSKAKITDKEYRRFEEIFYRVWHYHTFGHDKHVKLTSQDLKRVTNTLEELKQTRHREHNIIVRHYIQKVYYTTVAREQGDQPQTGRKYLYKTYLIKDYYSKYNRIESAYNVGDMGSIPRLGRFPGEGNSYPPQYSDLENSMDYIVHGVAKSQTQISNFHFHFSFKIYMAFFFFRATK